jgi:MerR family mercuric resistance operon transcriptional regulator
MVRSEHEQPLTIGEFAAAAEVGVETVRFYQRRELLRKPPRGAGIRHYGREDVRRLHFIRRAQASGFTLEEIRELLGLEAGQDRARARALASGRIKALEEKIAILREAAAALRRLERECAKGAKGPCPILASFDL